MIYRFLKAYYLSIILALFILLLSLIKIDTSESPGILNFPHADKVVHFIFYLILGFVILFDHGRINPVNRKYFLRIILFCVIYGGVIELLQLGLPFRSADIFDLLADAAGSILSIPFYKIIGKRFFKRSS